MANIISIGCGIMGSQLIRAFLEAGHHVTIVNRTQSKAAPYVALGADYFPTLSEAHSAGTDASLIVINVSDYDLAAALINGAPEAVKDRIVVNLTTGEGDKVTAFANRIEELGGRFLCGVLTCYPKNIGADRDGSVVFAGDPGAWADAWQVLAALSPSNFFVGTDPALAAVMDIAWLTPHYGLYWGILQGAASCRAAGIDPAQYANAIRVMITTLLDVICPNVKELAQTGACGAATDASMAIQAAAIDEIVSGLEKAGFDGAPLRCIGALAEKAVAAGDGDKNFEALIDHLKR